jgi:diguanylate cyclase (GGDEF)-like protein/PAS domain S-box-containing protein
MTLPKNSLLRWVNTLKFKIVAMAVIAAVLSAVGATQLVLSTTRADLERLLLSNDADDSERMAKQLSDKVELLKLALVAVAHRSGPEQWLDQEHMLRFLMDKPAVNAMFGSVFAARTDGELLAHVKAGVPSDKMPSIRDREYFHQVLNTDQPVVSRPVLGKVSGRPVVFIAVPVVLGGKIVGAIAGSLELDSSGLFSELAGSKSAVGVSTLVIDREGTLLAHPDPARVLSNGLEEPGLTEVLRPWHASGSPIETHGRAMLTSGNLVSMAGIALSDWTLVRVTPQALAMEPLVTARRTAWRAAAGVALLAGLLAGMLAWQMTRPISSLRARAELLLTETEPAGAGWPQHKGEVGELALAFQHVIEQRQQRQSETQAMLHQIEAVLDHAEVGIAFTRNGHFELVSRQFCHIFRCEKQHVVGEATRLIHASDEAYQALSERARPAFMEHGAFDGELELMRRSGQTFWAHMRGRAVVAGDRSQGTIWIIEDVTVVRDQRERLAWTSSHDSLTGLANRAAFEVLLERATAQAEDEPFCALFIDLDRFKLVNDTAGHAAGDALLRDVASELAAQVRKSDTVARLGGDEFAVLLSNCPLPQAELIAEKLRSAVVAYQMLWEGHVFGVGASIGLVPVDASYATAADVLRAADAACYAAKRQGRNCVAVHGAVPAPAPVEPAATWSI